MNYLIKLSWKTIVPSQSC